MSVPDIHHAAEVSDHAAPPNLRQFTLDFFSFFGAQVVKEDRRKNGILRIDLSEPLADYFDVGTMRLCFEHADSRDGCELVAYGSRLFDQMIEYLENRSASTLLALPRRHTSSEELMHAIRPRNASIIDLKMSESQRYLYLFNWRLTFRSDEVFEEIFTVMLNHDGERMKLTGPNTVQDGTLALDVLFSDGECMTGDFDEAESSIKMPPMTQLVRMAEVARKYAVYHADVQCANQESEILSRLYRTLNRITTYYGQQIEEVYDTHDRDGEKRRVLEEDLQRKIAEEVENHRLRVRVELLSYALFEVPVAVSAMILSDGRQETTVEVELNRYTGVIRRPLCHACGDETRDLALDKYGHITCDECIRQCETCGEIVCADCGVEECPVCGKANCADCGEMCWACGERACPEHIDACPICGDHVCHSCQEVCSHCGIRQCRSHLVVDTVVGDKGNYALICETCAVRCPACHQYSARLGICAASGQQFCQNCLVTCSKCGEQFGPGFYQSSGEGRIHCVKCLVECPSCGQLTVETIQCPLCGVTYCSECGLTCDICGNHCCEGHYQKFASCGHSMCEDHMVICAVGGEPLCAVCSDTCGICERPVCEEHRERCRHCGQYYCANCVNARGLCDTCETVMSGNGVPVDLTDEPCSADLEAAAMARHYSWLRAGNQRYIVYDGRNRLMGGAVIVVDVTGGADNVVAVRRIGLLELMRDRILGSDD